MRVLITSDWHIDARFGTISRWPEFCRFIDWLETVIREQSIDWLLVGGDYFDPGRITDLLNAGRLVSVARRLHGSLPPGGGSVWIAGNHDITTSSHGATTLRPLLEAALPGMCIVENHSQGFISMGLDAVLAFPHVTGTVGGTPQWEAARRHLSESDGHLVILGHYDISGAVMGTESAEMARGREQQFPVDDVGALYRLAPERVVVVNGHYHKPQVIDLGFPVHIPGSPLRLDFGERDDGCGVIVLEMP